MQVMKLAYCRRSCENHLEKRHASRAAPVCRVCFSPNFFPTYPDVSNGISSQRIDKIAPVATLKHEEIRGTSRLQAARVFDAKRACCIYCSCNQRLLHGEAVETNG